VADVDRGLTAFVADTFVRHKPFIRVWFNTAQFMLASGLCSLVYTALGGSVSLEASSTAPARIQLLLSVRCLVIVYFLVNHGALPWQSPEQRRVSPLGLGQNW